METNRQRLRIEPAYYDWWMSSEETLYSASPLHPLAVYLDKIFGRDNWVWIVPKPNTKQNEQLPSSKARLITDKTKS